MIVCPKGSQRSFGSQPTSKAIEMLLDCGFGRSPQQLDIAHSVSNRPLEHLSDGLLVENAEQLKDGSGVVVDGEFQTLKD